MESGQAAQATRDQTCGAAKLGSTTPVQLDLDSNILQLSSRKPGLMCAASWHLHPSCAGKLEKIVCNCVTNAMNSVMCQSVSVESVTHQLQITNCCIISNWVEINTNWTISMFQLTGKK